MCLTNYYKIVAPTKQVDASQEIFALGMCQLVGSFAGSLPITASFGSIGAVGLRDHLQRRLLQALGLLKRTENCR